jgi:hypothetical protein
MNVMNGIYVVITVHLSYELVVAFKLMPIVFRLCLLVRHDKLFLNKCEIKLESFMSYGSCE